MIKVPYTTPGYFESSSSLQLMLVQKSEWLAFEGCYEDTIGSFVLNFDLSLYWNEGMVYTSLLCFLWCFQWLFALAVSLSMRKSVCVQNGGLCKSFVAFDFVGGELCQIFVVISEWAYLPWENLESRGLRNSAVFFCCWRSRPVSRTFVNKNRAYDVKYRLKFSNFIAFLCFLCAWERRYVFACSVIFSSLNLYS